MTSRVDLRGKRLDEDCRKARISTNECGINDDRKFCLGLIEMSTECLIEKCIKCNAHVSNVKMLGM